MSVDEKIRNSDYYINDNGDIEKLSVTVVDGYAKFTTNHFSVYMIAVNDEEVLELSPKTFDSGVTYIVIGIIR